MQSAVDKGSGVAAVTGSMGVTTDILGMLGVLLSADQTGATLKFSQVSKLISRLRYVDINYGKIFGTFLNGLGNAFDKKTSFDAATEFQGKKGEELEDAINTAVKRMKFQDKFSTGNKGKFNTYLVDFFLIGKSNKGWMDELLFDTGAEPGEKTNQNSASRVLAQSLGSFKIKRESGFSFGAFIDELKFWLYILSWLNKVIAMHLVTKSKEWDEISVGFFNYVTFSQKIHFVLFNLVSVDVVFLGTRTILHTKLVRAIGYYWIWTIFVYNLVILDIVQIAYLSSTLVYSTYKMLKAESGQKLTQEDGQEKVAGKIELGKSQNDSAHGLRKHEVSQRSFAL